jgi:hypothetical protein
VRPFKRIAAKVFGPILLVLGCLLLFTMVSTLWSRRGHAFSGIDWFIYVGLICFFIWGGLRAVRMGFGTEEIVVSQMKVWKLTLGFLLITIEIKNRLEPGPNLFKPANEAQALGMLITEVLFYALGVWLIVSGIRAKYNNPAVSVDQVS